MGFEMAKTYDDGYKSRILQRVREFGAKELSPVAGHFDKIGIFPTEVYEKLFALNFHMLGIPLEHGGMQPDSLGSAYVLEELARFDAGVAIAMEANALAFKPLLFAGTQKQIEHFVSIIKPGALASFCVTEPNAGSNFGIMKTNAKKVGDSYLLNGHKSFVSNGGKAKVFVVLASTDLDKEHNGQTAFLVERNTPGVSLGEDDNKMGLRLLNTTDVFFENVEVPAANRIGDEGQGHTLALDAFSATRPMAAAAAVGLCQACIDLCLSYAKERLSYGKPLVSLQIIQHMLSTMEILTETARRYVYHAAGLISRGKPHVKEAAIAKSYAADAAMKVSTDAVQIFGGHGYTQEYPVEKLMRDAKAFQILEGTNQILSNVIAYEMVNE